MLFPIVPRIAFVAAVALSTTFGDAGAATLTPFFGQDLGRGETERLSSTPNADAARNAFIRTTGSGHVESFEGIADGSFAATQDANGTWTLGRDLAFSGSYGSDTPRVTGSIAARTGTFVEQPTGTNGFGRYPTDGDTFFHSSADQIVIEFDREVVGFGLDIIDIGDFDGQLTVDVYNGMELVHALTIAHAVDTQGGDVLFWGIVDHLNPFTKLVFNNNSLNSDVFAIDNALVVTPVPAALPLLATGFAGLIWMRRRRRG